MFWGLEGASSNYYPSPGEVDAFLFCSTLLSFNAFGFGGSLCRDTLDFGSGKFSFEGGSFQIKSTICNICCSQVALRSSTLTYG